MSTVSRALRSFATFMTASVRTAYHPRDQVIEALDSYLARSHNGHMHAGLLLIEIDEFPTIDVALDTRSLSTLLNSIQAQIADGPGLRHMIRHLDGGRFAIVPHPQEVRSAESIGKICRVLHQVLSRPFRCGRQTIHPTFSIGYVAQDQLTDPTGDSLFDAALLALRAAQQVGPVTTRAFAPDMLNAAIDRDTLRARLVAALKSGAIQAYFQPQVSLRNQTVTGVEALARWCDPEDGIIPPADFLPQMEELGLMRELGHVILRDALNALAAWRAAGIPIPAVSFNLSSDELRNPNLVAMVGYELERANLVPGDLVIEVLETVVASGANDSILTNLTALSQMGCQVDLDDFGTGHASITAIRTFNVDRIKIDRSFVSIVSQSRDNLSMIEAMVVMANRLTVATLAEGAETAEDIELLARTGCNEVQGYGVARPLPRDEVAEWVTAWTGRAVPALSAM